MSKTFSQNEHKILSMLGMCKGFNYNNKHYEIKIIGLTDTLESKMDNNKNQEVPEIVQDILSNVKKRNAML